MACVAGNTSNKKGKTISRGWNATKPFVLRATRTKNQKQLGENTVLLVQLKRNCLLPTGSRWSPLSMDRPVQRNPRRKRGVEHGLHSGPALCCDLRFVGLELSAPSEFCETNR